MLTENIGGVRMDSKPTFQQIQARNRRLADIRRGQAYFQKLDSLAERQWNKNTPHNSAGQRQLVSIRPLTDSQQHKSKNRHLMLKPDFENNRIHSERPRGSDRILHEGFFHSDSSVPRQNVINDNKNQSTYFRNGCADKVTEPTAIFNKWGSGIHPLDEKVTLTNNDMTPHYEPFRFRDSVKHVVKPMPKHFKPMSRVNHHKERQSKVHTNFMSRNGMVNINPGLEQWPELESESKQNTFIREPDLLQKEKTVIFMNRVDKILDPFRQHNDKMEITSSDEECIGSTSPSISDISDVKDVLRSSKRRDVCIFQTLPLYPKYITQPQQKKRIKNLTFPNFLTELNKQPMGASRKCKIWVNNLETIVPSSCKN